jgi:1-acyl-sn-glycerol-3-phosphate acyltransferase
VSRRTSEHPVHIPDLPSEQSIDRLVAILAPVARITQPKVCGIERIPDDGVLFVGNHTIFGFMDLPFMMAELWKRRRMTVRGLGEHAHYALPLWRDLLAACGMVRGTRENVRALMRERQNVLVFPGGAREVNKRRGERYQLMWKERIGFARLAIEHRYPVVPFAAVGAEEMLDVVVDVNNPVMAAFKGALERLGRVPLEPAIVRGVGLSPLPRPQRLYFWFGDPIETSAYARRRGAEAAAQALRDEVKTAVEDGILFLHKERERDPHRSLVRRLRRRADE